MTSKLHKVNCSFCGSEMECPENMLDADMHMCFACAKNPPESAKKLKGKIHIDMPLDSQFEEMAAMMADTAVKEDFPRFWTQVKHEMKGMTKKEVAERMFGEGIFCATHNILASGMVDMEKKSGKSR